MSRKILFISSMIGNPFGGSEELWVRTAILLAKRGFSIAASVHGWPQLHERIAELSRAAVDLRPRPLKRSLLTRAQRYISGKDRIVFEVERSFGRHSPDLVVISNGTHYPPIALAEMCISKNWPFAIVTQVAVPTWWPSAEVATQSRRAFSAARRCYFVSKANRILLEKQLGHDFDNSEVVQNPVAVNVRAPLPWPNAPGDQQLRMACVGRLDPQKGQDILLEALADPSWMDRDWRLAFYGEGHTRHVLERLIQRFNLQDRVNFAGQVPPEIIWRSNHLLVMPSRFEGMPLALIEAMLCGRTAVATNVAGIPEIIEDGVTGFLAAPATECFGNALERMWRARGNLQHIGKVAAERAREFMPVDPVSIFAEKLSGLATRNWPDTSLLN